VNHANLVPPPVQQPHPPVYIAATRTPETLEFVVSTGHPLITGVVLDHDDVLDLCHRFVALSREAGHNVPLSAIPLFRYFYVAATEEEAVRDTRPAMTWTQDMIQWRRAFTEGSEVYQQMAEFRNNRPQQPPEYEYLREKRSIIGTPEQCVAKVKEFQDQGIEYFGCNFDFGGMAQRKVLRSMELFAKEVMPHFQ
jgi:alkanesulfonate monooxygenase SsuD/methylene tetrahydromethanopterin reductase-like flavin-dependent oxidoreductase (luciferase family)